MAFVDLKFARGSRRGWEREGEGEEKNGGGKGIPWRFFHDAESLKKYRLPFQDGEVRVPIYFSCLPRSH